jgi:hypothetical protein
MSEGRPPAPRPGFDAPLAEFAPALAPVGASTPVGPVAALLGRLVSDATGLLSAAASARRGAS